MVLTRIKPARIGFELRVFLGVNCDHVDKVVTETHSMKWMCSGRERRLRPPACSAPSRALARVWEGRWFKSEADL
jgi:hypothetical protein